MKLMTVVGARPQFIKAAPFSSVFRRKHVEILVHTGQHYDPQMSRVFFDELGIPEPDYNLGIGSASHGAQTGRMLEAIEQVILKDKPDGVLVYGDTNSTLAGALAASKLHVPVFHVEAGLRSYDMLMPEEQNRVLTDRISTLLLCPTETAVANLSREGITRGVYNTGDIVRDSVLRNVATARMRYGDGEWLREIRRACGTCISLVEGCYYLATVHREENTDDRRRLVEIVTALNELDKPVLLPLHPRTRKAVETLDVPLVNVTAIDPVGYLLMLYLIENAYMVLTDSGGLQKEAYFLGTPCTTLRDETEWVETLKDGWNVLSSADMESIVRCATRDLSSTLSVQPDQFGDGHAAERIVSAIEHFVEEGVDRGVRS